MIVGTAYFRSHESAVAYYRAYGFDRAAVFHKIHAGEIHVGKPPMRAGESLLLVDDGRRYAIETRES